VTIQELLVIAGALVAVVKLCCDWVTFLWIRSNMGHTHTWSQSWLMLQL